MESDSVSRQLADELSGVVGSENVITDTEILQRYANGSFRNIPGLTDQWRFLSPEAPGPSAPRLVVSPGSAEEVSAVLRAANRRRTPVTVWAGATNFVGDDVPAPGGIVLETKRMNRIIKIDPEELTVTVQPGVKLMDLELELQKHGLRHGTYPGSALWVTVGGSICSDAHTLTGFKYGTMAENLLEVEAVTPMGEVFRTGPWYGSGYNLRDIFTRSEGTLGVVTEATVRVRRMPPSPAVSVGFTFPSFAEAFRLHRRILKSDLAELSTIMTFDRFATKFPALAESTSLEHDGGTLVTLEGREGGVRDAEQLVKDMAGAEKGSSLQARRDARIDEWWSLLTGPANDLIGSGKPIEGADWKVGPHVWVPQRSVLQVREAYIRLVSDEGMKYTGLVYTPTRLLLQFLYDHNQPERCAQAYRRVCANLAPIVHSVGGTIAGAHGCGLVFKGELRDVQGASVGVMRSIKTALDPNGIMNPGKVLD